MLQRNWKNIVVFVLGFLVVSGLFFAAFVVTVMCRSGVGWPICYMQ